VSADSTVGVDAAIGSDSTVGTDSAIETGSAIEPDSADNVDTGGGVVVNAGAPVCTPAATWGPGTLLPISTAGLDRFGAITPDELTIAWMTPTDSGTTGTVYYADRDTVSAPFGTPTALPSAAGYFSFGQVALSPDGLMLVVVRADGQGFGACSRSSRPATFGSPDETAFNQVDLNHADMPDPGVALADPVFAQDGTSLFFTETAPTTVNPIVSVDLVAGLWTHFTMVTSASSLAVSSGKLRRPTGLSSDRRTLFFYDEVASLERGAWRDSANGQFSTFADVGALMGAQPNRACTRLYYSAQGATSVDLFYADAN
jgi:hypothetical protein